jgi:nucleotide-binding universal stress UspA family protein
VLCAVDFSAHSRRALRYAAAAAKRLNATLTVLFVEDPLLMTAADVADQDAALVKKTNDELRRLVRQSIGESPGAPIEYVVAVGKAAAEIEKAAASRGAAVIVVGTAGLRGARHIFLGSTTRQLLRTAQVPVLAIPPKTPAKPVSKWPRHRVAAAVDLDDHTLMDARAAAQFAHRLGASLMLVHVLPGIQRPPWMTLRRGRDATLTEAADAELRRVAKALGTETDIETQVLVGSPAEAIASFVKRRFDLVILTLRRGKDLGSRPGSLTYELLTLAATPVLAIPGTPARE